MISEILSTIHNWWFADRIRFTPGHSRLFPMRVGNRVLVRDRLWVVLDREDRIAHDAVTVVFKLAEFDEVDSETALLCIRLQKSGFDGAAVDWIVGGLEELLLEEDIVVFKAD